MPILSRDIDLYPDDLLQRESLGNEPGLGWWALYSIPRHEKELMRRLRARTVPFYGPLVAKRTKSPAGRVRTSYMPLFTSYVFIYGDYDARYEALTTNCVSRWVEVPNNLELTKDLRQIRQLIQADVPLTVESRLEPGTRVRVKSGPFKSLEGTVIRREGVERFVIAVNFLQQGASITIDDFRLEPIL